MSLSGSTIALMFLSSLLCLPPYLAYLLFARSKRRARRHGLPTRRYRAAMWLSFAAFFFNLVTFGTSVVDMSRGEFSLGPMEILAVALAWISFWVWLFLTTVTGRKLRHSRRPLRDRF